jgi:hypothetical protein
MNLICPLVRLAMPANWFQRAVCRHILGSGPDHINILLRVRVIASLLYFGAAVLAVGTAFLLVAIDSALGVSFC